MNMIGGKGIPIEVLLIDDSPGDVRLTKEPFRAANPSINLPVVSDGVEAMIFLRQEGIRANVPRPDLILLDLNLPRMDGREVLARIEGDESLKTIPTVILSTSDAAFDALVKSINDFWLTKVKLPQNRPIR
jgi:two-component system, chemotaxis family, response regulator Rcp1